MATSRSKEPLVSVPPPQNMSMPVPEYNSRHINVGPVPENTVLPALYPPYQQQCYRSPAQYQYLPSYSAPSMSNPPASSANPQHIWAPTPLPYTVNHQSGWNHSSGFQGKAPTPIPWTPKPMSIDPRSGDPRNPSWPHPLHTRETGQLYGKTLMPIAEVSMPSPPRRHRRALSAMQSSMTGLRRDVRHPSEPSARAPVVLPMAKACHNFLLARRMQSAKRKTQLRQHAKRMTQGTERPASPMHIDQYPSPHQVPPSTSIRPVSSIAHVVQGRPPVKRRREASPESHPLLSPAEITERNHAQREYQDCEADFTKMLNVAVQGQMSESQEREMRRAIWIEEEQRRAASAASSQGSKKKRSHRYGSHMR